MKRIVSTIGLFCILVQAFPQKDRTFQEKFYNGNFELLYNRYGKALPFYLELSEEYPENANVSYLVGLCYSNMPGHRMLALPYLEKASERINVRYRTGNHREKKASAECIFLLGICRRVNREFDAAIELFRRYQELVPAGSEKAKHEIESCGLARSLIRNPVRPFFAETLQFPGAGKNLYRPCVSADAKSMVFMSKKEYYQAIYYSTFRSGWSEAVNITAQVESDGNYECVSLSPDGRILLLTNISGSNQDLFYSRLSNGRWSRLKAIPGEVNSRFNESGGCFSGSGDTLFFTSDRPGGMGGLDIYRAVADKAGNWMQAVNLGPQVNTLHNEEDPSIHGNILYFSSQGHGTMGGYDVFKSLLENNNWQKAENLGYPVSTTDDDRYYSPVADQLIAYTSGFPDHENPVSSILVYTFREKKVAPVIARVEGRLLVSSPGLLKTIRISLLDPSKGDTVSHQIPGKDGKFNFSLPPGTYRMIVKGSQVETREEEVVLRDDGQTVCLDLEIQSRSDAEPAAFLLRTIYFEFDRYSVGDSFAAWLAELAGFMTAHPGVTIMIHGHTDAIGNEAYNLVLSRRRAEAVKQVLVGKGADPSRIMIKYHGEGNPIAANTTPGGKDSPEGRRYNRRTEFSVVDPAGTFIKPEEPAIPPPLRIN